MTKGPMFVRVTNIKGRLLAALVGIVERPTPNFPVCGPPWIVPVKPPMKPNFLLLLNAD
jgi:hypothetical protein